LNHGDTTDPPRTLRVRIDDLMLLVDPMLGDKGSMASIANSANPEPNPMVALPMPAAEVLNGVDALLVTHIHRDHWDAAATELIPRAMRILCQPPDATFFRELGFEDVRPVHSAVAYGMVTIARTPGEHGNGEIGQKMAPVSGYVLRSRAGESLYIAGDTILCHSVRKTLKDFAPEVMVVNCGGARFLEGDPITMTAEEVAEVARLAPETQVIAVHMEAINHCGVRRPELERRLLSVELPKPVLIPRDGELLTLSAAPVGIDRPI
jgi:L-ascorbate metabolism protein UlaG (beta-lactamase superfamily)